MCDFDYSSIVQWSRSPSHKHKEDVGECAEIQSQLIGLHPGRGCSVCKDKELLFLDSVLHVSPATVDFFVNLLGITILQVGYYKSWI
jgi:hypothetical protein